MIQTMDFYANTYFLYILYILHDINIYDINKYITYFFSDINFIQNIINEFNQILNHLKKILIITIKILLLNRWDGKYLRKKPKKIIDDDDDILSDEECVDEEEYYEEEIVVEEKKNDNFEECINDTFKTNMDLSWKLKLPDEFANITFINNNTYSGRISRKMMEGEGVYRWINGAQYKVRIFNLLFS